MPSEMIPTGTGGELTAVVSGNGESRGFGPYRRIGNAASGVGYLITPSSMTYVLWNVRRDVWEITFVRVFVGSRRFGQIPVASSTLDLDQKKKKKLNPTTPARSKGVVHSKSIHDTSTGSRTPGSTVTGCFAFLKPIFYSVLFYVSDPSFKCKVWHPVSGVEATDFWSEHDSGTFLPSFLLLERSVSNPNV